MKILLLCNKSPWPPKEGGPIAMHAIVSGLIKAGHKVKVLAANTNKYFVDPASIPESFSCETGIELATINLAIKPLDALINYLRNRSYHVARFYSKDYEQKLVAILKNEDFDIIQTEMIYTTVYLETIRKYSKAKVVLRAHNIEHRIWMRIAGNSKNFLKKRYLTHLYRTLMDYELKIIKRVDGIVAITETDASYFRKFSDKVPVISIPFGIDPDDMPVSSKLPETHDLFHIGSMNWLPNEEGILWFLDNVWPKVHSDFPSLKLYLAGRMMPEWLSNRQEQNLVIAGEVPDALKFFQQHSVMIVPLFSGSGIRIKIIEAMCSARVVISTTIGAEGIQYSHGRDLLIANSSDEFIQAIRLITENQELKETIGKNARRLIESQHNNRNLMDCLTGFYNELCKTG